jgi:serine/threonine protein kinase
MAVARDDLRDMIGQQVGRYTILRHLASGGMAELYIARQESVGGFEKELVVKILQPRYAENRRVVQMFLDEARLAARLNHPSIVHVYDVVDEGGRKFIAMEYIHGETIADIVTRGLQLDNYLPIEHAVHVIRQAAAGLAYAHERPDIDGRVLRVVHRDVSPTNILVSYEGQTKIVDFGIARAQDELREESGVRPGKASYMSPEQVRGGEVDYRSDIFSLGIILYELTLCQRLYRGPADQVMRRIVEQKVAPPTAVRRDYPPALELVVMRALEKRPEDRYQSAEEMRHDLEEFLDDHSLRTGTRRVGLYLQELFRGAEGPASRADSRLGEGARGTPAAQPLAVVVEDNSEELDFDRRAPLAMKVEVAPEPKPPAGRAAPAPGSAGPTPSLSPAAAVTESSPPQHADGRASAGKRTSWGIVVAFIILGIAAMVFLTLR